MKLLLEAILIVTCLFVLACSMPIEKESADLYEDAIVQALAYSPSTHGEGSGPVMGFDGKMGMAFTSVTTEEKYAVVFQCKHGSFVVDRQEVAKDLFGRLHTNQKVRVKYRELYTETADDGAEGNFKRTLTGYRFINAVAAEDWK